MHIYIEKGKKLQQLVSIHLQGHTSYILMYGPPKKTNQFNPISQHNHW